MDGFIDFCALNYLYKGLGASLPLWTLTSSSKNMRFTSMVLNETVSQEG